jgi:hypothetical protein
MLNSKTKKKIHIRNYPFYSIFLGYRRPSVNFINVLRTRFCMKFLRQSQNVSRKRTFARKKRAKNVGEIDTLPYELVTLTYSIYDWTQSYETVKQVFSQQTYFY